jgi:serine/threonine-protein kinase
VFLLEQVCHSLAEAHEGGLIHRDVKPANIFTCRYGIDSDFVKLLDFGLVKNPVADRTGSVTMTGVIAGTPGYMSPEMGLGSADVDWRTDIYALGCVAYWLLTGHRVFEEGTPIQVLMDHVQKTPEPPSRRIEGGLPPELDRIVLACLEKDPNNRPQTARELAERLRAVPVGERWSDEKAQHWWLAHAVRPGRRSRRARRYRISSPEGLTGAPGATPAQTPAQLLQAATSSAPVQPVSRRRASSIESPRATASRTQRTAPSPRN